MPITNPKPAGWKAVHKSITNYGNNPIAILAKNSVKKGIALKPSGAGVSKKSKTRKEVSKALNHEIAKLVSFEGAKPSEVKAKSRVAPAKILVNTEVKTEQIAQTTSNDACKQLKSVEINVVQDLKLPLKEKVTENISGKSNGKTLPKTLLLNTTVDAAPNKEQPTKAEEPSDSAQEAASDPVSSREAGVSTSSQCQDPQDRPSSPKRMPPETPDVSASLAAAKSFHANKENWDSDLKVFSTDKQYKKFRYSPQPDRVPLKDITKTFQSKIQDVSVQSVYTTSTVVQVKSTSTAAASSISTRTRSFSINTLEKKKNPFVADRGKDKDAPQDKPSEAADVPKPTAPSSRLPVAQSKKDTKEPKQNILMMR
ncbi:hypothetical protein HDU91_002568 [Kappamyces sp. JEL0680]|nr:hypothetical protein HDU91_002568 [Kappamyces sp. JEL0680]